MAIKAKRLVIAIAIAIMITVISIPVLMTAQVAQKKFDPYSQICTERKISECKAGLMCFSCLSVFIGEFPECCKTWVDRPKPDKFASCVDDLFVAHGQDVINMTDASKFMSECVQFDRDTFLGQMKNLTDRYNDKYNRS